MKKETKRKNVKRGYFVYPADEFFGVAIVATSVAEAKKVAFASGELDDDWINIRCHWQRDADVSKLPMGIVSDLHTALVCGIYGFVEDFICDGCGDTTLVRGYNGQALCDDCIVKAQNEKKRDI